ncbi:putative pectate lyase 12 [Capsicum chinense]|nr:putative pectate lyase 12 [Capsicum chinense]
MASSVSEVVWITTLLKELEFPVDFPVIVHSDSKTALQIAANPVFHEKAKHIEIDCHFIRQKILEGLVKTEHVDSKHQLADIVIKGLARVQHEFLVSKLGVLNVFTPPSLRGSVENRDCIDAGLPHPHPYPEVVVQDVQRKVNESISRRKLLDTTINTQCQTGNPIDDCWRCDPNWSYNRQRLADCALGFGQDAMGGKNGKYYVVNDPSDTDNVNPVPGTLRHAVIQDEPLWITFSGDMNISLKHELIFNSYKTVDGRGANVQITGNGCITLEHISNVIIHNIHISNCIPSGSTEIRTTPSNVAPRGGSDGDGITISGSHNIWIDHCALSHCTDGLIDVIMGSTGITISNNYFTDHDKVMLLGHNDAYLGDTGMQVTIAFNHFGVGLVQRMPRCRRGYTHVVNNDFTEWQMYAIGGSANPTINSQGNRYTAPKDSNTKEVTRRMDADEGEWKGWNWRTDGDIMVNGAFFVASGDGKTNQYAKASSLEPQSSDNIDQLTLNAGVFNATRNVKDEFMGC